MSSVVVDASAIIAVIRREKGYENVLGALNGAAVSCVNVSEVIYKALSKGASIESVRWAIEHLPIVAVPFDLEQAKVAATLHSATHRRGVSFADRACLALALTRQAMVITSDSEWDKLGLGIRIKQFR